MTPVPADMLLFFMIRMDIPMIENMLDESEQYAGMAYTDFIAFLEQGFARHQAWGDSSILALQGKYGYPAKVGYSFMGNKSFEQLKLVFVADEDKQVVDIIRDDSFRFDDNNFVIKK